MTDTQQTETAMSGQKPAAYPCRVEPLVLRSSRCTATLYLADCLSLLPIEADAVVSDPPYGMNYVSHHNSGRGDCDMVRKDGNFDAIIGDDKPFDPSPWLQYATVALFGAQHFSDSLPSSRGWLVWDKLAGKTPCRHSDCELVWTNRDMPVRIKTHLWRGIMRDGEENVVNGGKLHPNQKPVAVMSWLLEQLRIEDGATVLDPFMGSGSTGIACIRRGLHFIGIEQDERYFEIAADRLRRELAQERMF